MVGLGVIAEEREVKPILALTPGVTAAGVAPSPGQDRRDVLTEVPESRGLLDHDLRIGDRRGTAFGVAEGDSNPSLSRPDRTDIAARLDLDDPLGRDGPFHRRRQVASRPLVVGDPHDHLHARIARKQLYLRRDQAHWRFGGFGSGGRVGRSGRRVRRRFRTFDQTWRDLGRQADRRWGRRRRGCAATNQPQKADHYQQAAVMMRQGNPLPVDSTEDRTQVEPEQLQS